MTTALHDHTCPYCGTAHDCSTAVANDKLRPSSGDVSICAQCAGLALFDDDLQLRKPTEKEQVELDKALAESAHIKSVHDALKSRHQQRLN